jgi:hypothetical protein
MALGSKILSILAFTFLAGIRIDQQVQLPSMWPQTPEYVHLGSRRTEQTPRPKYRLGRTLNTLQRLEFGQAAMLQARERVCILAIGF